MRIKTILLSAACLVALADASAQQSPKKANKPNNSQSIRESSMPEEWRNEMPAGSSLKAPSVVMKEAPSEATVIYKNLASFAKGKADKPVDLGPTDSKVIRLVALYTPANASWAKSIDKGELKLDGAKANALLTKYNMALSKVYEAETVRYGLVLKFTGSGANVAEAARELSLLEGVSTVLVKTPK